jgi:HAE1 family hydrophobic/amphiphilic exporter-1
VDLFIAPQGFDVLAMLGFIILIGTVVNNAILIVHQSLNNVRYNGMQGLTAISDAVQTRIRPIFMSATTSLLGMLPLVLSTGSGSELSQVDNGLGDRIGSFDGLGVGLIVTLGNDQIHQFRGQIHVRLLYRTGLDVPECA